MKTKLNINRDISIFESKNISGLLVGIDKIVYLDTDIIQNKIEKNDIFIPRYKSGYVLYFLDSAQINAYSITILPRTIYHNNIPIDNSNGAIIQRKQTLFCLLIRFHIFKEIQVILRKICKNARSKGYSLSFLIK